MVLAWGWACTSSFFCSTLLLPKVTFAIPVALHLARPKVLCLVTSFVASEISGLHRAHLKLLLAGAVFKQYFHEAEQSEPGQKYSMIIHLLDKSGTESDTALLHRQENEDEGKMGPT